MRIRLGSTYRRAFGQDLGRERLFLAGVGFICAFAVTRAVTHALHAEGGGGEEGLNVAGVHIHHLVWGILAILVIAAGWCAGLWTAPDRGGRISAVAFGVASALVIDEFPLWLTLRDVYWARGGRGTVDIVVVLAGLGWLGYLGRPLARALRRS